ncbi:HAD family hydrolase [Streptomyces sp. NPDC055400]
MAEETEGLRELIKSAQFVIFDFDGPICRLFARRKAERIAADLVEWLEVRGLHSLLSSLERQSLDPQVVLRAVDRRRPQSDLVEELEERLTQEELRAASSAWPTEYADPLIRTWKAVGAHLAIATNNSPRAAKRYLATRGLTECFSPHIYGRTQDLHRLKPDPHCLLRAMNALGADPTATLMIGDTPSDYEAAIAAEVHFLGYAHHEDKAKVLHEAGAQSVVGSLESVRRILMDQA